MALSDLDRPKLKKYIKTTIESRHSSDPSDVHKTELSLVDYIKDTYAKGFSKNLQLRETKFLGIFENTYTYIEPISPLEIQDVFHNKDAKGFTKRQAAFTSQFAGVKKKEDGDFYTYPDSQGLGLGNIGVQDRFHNKDAKGFSLNFVPGSKTKFEGVKDNKYTYPNTLGLNFAPDWDIKPKSTLRVSYMPSPAGSTDIDATGFTVFQDDLNKTKFLGIDLSSTPNTYTYPDNYGFGFGNLGVVDYMDGVPKGKGFIQPGNHPKGFTKNMTTSKYMSDGRLATIDNINILSADYKLLNRDWIPNTLSITKHDTRRFYAPQEGVHTPQLERRYPNAWNIGPMEHMGLTIQDSAMVDKYVENLGDSFTSYEDLMKKAGPFYSELLISPGGRAIAEKFPIIRTITDLGIMYDAIGNILKDPKQLFNRQQLNQLSSPTPNTRILNPIYNVGGSTPFLKQPRTINLSQIQTAFVDTLNELTGRNASKYGVYERFEGYDWNRKDKLNGTFSWDSWAGVMGQEGAKEASRRDTGNKLYQWTIARFIDSEGATGVSVEKQEQKKKMSTGEWLLGVAGDAWESQVIEPLEDLRDSTIMAVTGERKGVPTPPKQYVKSQRKLHPDGEKVNLGVQPKTSDRYASLDYENLDRRKDYSNLTDFKGYEFKGKYEDDLFSGGEKQNILDKVPGPIGRIDDGPPNVVKALEDHGMVGGAKLMTDYRAVGKAIVDNIGQQGISDGATDLSGINQSVNHGLGLTSSPKSARVDKVNLYPPTIATAGELPSDFIKFRFKDVINNKFLIFRAILSGINDNITPEWQGEKYIGRADKVYVYTGAERNISFNFAIAPKSKIEFPNLIRKLNALIGLCYPEYDKDGYGNARMVAPFIELTMGDILHNTPGFLNSLSYTVEESSTWEFDEGLQFPKFINVSCDFRYIGKDIPEKYGKHLQYGNDLMERYDKPTPQEKVSLELPGVDSVQHGISVAEDLIQDFFG